MYVHRSDDLCFRLPEDAVSYALLQLKVRSLLLTEENLPLIAKKKATRMYSLANFPITPTQVILKCIDLKGTIVDTLIGVFLY